VQGDGISTVAVHSERIAAPCGCGSADESVCHRPPSAAKILNIPSIIAAAEITGAQAIHPGYGFSFGKRPFRRDRRRSRFTFMGPSPSTSR